MDAYDIIEMDFDWINISYENIVMLYNKMGWELDEKIKGIEMSLDYAYNCFFMELSFHTYVKRLKY